MKLLVVSYKRCRADPSSPSGYATDGGFPIQMRALSELFDETMLIMEDGGVAGQEGDIALVGHRLTVRPLPRPAEPLGSRKFGLVAWTLRNLPALLRAIRAHDAVHTPVPCDTGSIAMLLAWLLRKPLYVRHCGNWLETRTMAERFWKWFMEATAGGRNIMLATGGAAAPPSSRNPCVRWIFSTTLTEQELRQCAARVRVFPAGEIRLVTVGRQEGRKGTDLLLEAAALLRGEGRDIRVHVAGDGAELPSLRALAASLGIAHVVLFHGKLSHDRVLALLKDAHIFCFPTESEGFPKAVLEALSSGLPVVTTRVSVLPLLLAGGGGVLLDERSAEAVADGVRACLADPGVYLSMSASASRSAAAYSLEAWQRTLGDILSPRWGALRDA